MKILASLLIILLLSCAKKDPKIEVQLNPSDNTSVDIVIDGKVIKTITKEETEEATSSGTIIEIYSSEQSN